MNERIRELAFQAMSINQKVSDDSFFVEVSKLKEFEKFTKLIVKECIDCCEQVISDPVPESVDTWLNGGSQCIQEIKQHFGVEE